MKLPPVGSVVTLKFGIQGTHRVTAHQCEAGRFDRLDVQALTASGRAKPRTGSIGIPITWVDKIVSQPKSK